MPTVAIIRPGETDFDHEERIQGSLDLPLSDHGRQQLTKLVDHLRSLPILQVYASPTDPALSTAQAIGEALDVPVKALEGLANMSHGLWEGLSVDEIRRKQPKVFKQWHESPDSVCPPEGETCAEVTSRLRKALKKPLKRKAFFAVVCPEPLATLLSCILRGERSRLPVPGPSENGSLVELFELAPDDAVLTAAVSSDA